MVGFAGIFLHIQEKNAPPCARKATIFAKA
jgi:hypothetical protein